MDETAIDVEHVDLDDSGRVLSPPAEPQYRRATAVTVPGFLPHPDVGTQVDGTVVATAPVAFPDPAHGRLGHRLRRGPATAADTNDPTTPGR